MGDCNALSGFGGAAGTVFVNYGEWLYSLWSSNELSSSTLGVFGCLFSEAVAGNPAFFNPEQDSDCTDWTGTGF